LFNIHREDVGRTRSRSISKPRDRRRKGGRDSRSVSRSKSRDRKAESIIKPKKTIEVIDLNDDDMEGKTEEEADMMKLMGFAGFDSTKGKHIGGNDVSAVHHVVVRKYRQYMNRRGGFNRPLDFVN
jgi:U4/U6.U5 tri-snRNP-associated protein 3